MLIILHYSYAQKDGLIAELSVLTKSGQPRSMGLIF